MMIPGQLIKAEQCRLDLLTWKTIERFGGMVGRGLSVLVFGGDLVVRKLTS